MPSAPVKTRAAEAVSLDWMWFTLHLAFRLISVERHRTRVDVEDSTIECYRHRPTGSEICAIIRKPQAERSEGIVLELRRSAS